MQRFFSTPYSDNDYHESARRALRRLRIAAVVWVILLACTVVWFVFLT